MYTNYDDTPKATVTAIWKNLIFYIENLKQQRPNEEIDFSAEIKEDTRELSSFLVEFFSLKLEMIICSVQKYYAKNKTEFTQACMAALEERKKNPESFIEDVRPYYSFNKELNRTQVIRDFVDVSSTQLTISKLKGLNIVSQLLNDFFSLEELYEKHIRESSINILLRLNDYLNKFNFVEKFTTDFRHTLINNSLNGLVYPYQQDTKECTSISSLFTKEELKKLKTPQLLALAAFWINKAAKQVINLNKLVFVLDKSDLWQEAIAGKKYASINQNAIKPLLYKAEYFTTLETAIFDTVTCSSFDNPSYSDDELDQLYRDELDKKIEELDLVYKLHYSSSDELKNDIDLLHPLVNSQYLLYELKNLFLCNLLMGCIDEHYSKNWGIALDNVHPQYAGIIMDIEGLNMPLRLHMHTEKLSKFLTSYTGKTLIPLYKGQNDTKFINSPILAPIYKQQVNYIKQELQKTPTLSLKTLNYLRHILYLSNAKKLPPSLKNDNPNAPNAIDLVTGKTEHLSIKEMYK